MLFRVYKRFRASIVGMLLIAVVLVACAPGPAPEPTVEIEPPATETVMPATSEMAQAETPTPTIAPTESSPAAPAVTPTVTALTTPSSGPAGAPTLPAPAAAASNQRQIERKPGDLRAAWVHDNALATPAKIDETIRRAELGHVNVIVANVYEQGMTLYDSRYVSKHSIVQAGFNPLPYLVEQAHKRGIQVHAWFVNGPAEFRGKSEIMTKHPDWAIVGPDGKKMAWMNFTRPDVRQFISDLMWEAVTQYGVDGVFFDFTRYPGPEWGFDPYSINEFNSRHDFKLEELRYADLPAYGHFEGTPLMQPGTARVLATFSNGTPAVTINTYGQGQVLVFNWRASGREVGAASEIMRRGIKQFLKEGGQVYSYKPDGELDDNAEQSLGATANWLRDLGWPAREVVAEEVKGIAPSSVLVVSYGYDLSDQGVANMADFVNRGGGLIFIDGPSRSTNPGTIRAMTGMQGRGKKFEESTFLLAQGDHPLIPSSKREANLGVAQARDAKWKEFRKQGVNTLIQDIYRRIKAQYPQVDVSVTITSDQTTASQRTMQDWQAWLDGKYVDFLVPRGYVEEVTELDTVLSVWQPAMQKYKRVTLGVSTFGGKHGGRALKDPPQLLAEIDRARRAGSFGVMLWNLDNVNDEQLKSLASGPFQ